MNLDVSLRDNILYTVFLLLLLSFFFLRANLWHMEVTGLAVESELQLPACATAMVNTGSKPHL